MDGRPQRCPITSYKCHYCYAWLCPCCAIMHFVSCAQSIRIIPIWAEALDIDDDDDDDEAGFPWQLNYMEKFWVQWIWIEGMIDCEFQHKHGNFPILWPLSFTLWGCDLCGARHKSTCGTCGACSRQTSKSSKLQYLFLKKTGIRLTLRVDKKGILFSWWGPCCAFFFPSSWGGGPPSCAFFSSNLRCSDS